MQYMMKFTEEIHITCARLMKLSTCLSVSSQKRKEILQQFVWAKIDQGGILAGLEQFSQGPAFCRVWKKRQLCSTVVIQWLSS